MQTKSVQVRFSFDKETIKKIIKSFWISAWPAAAVFILGWINNFNITNVELAAFITFATSNLVYIVYKVRDGKLTWKKLVWSLILSGATSGIILLKSTTDWCTLGEICTLVYSMIALGAPTIINAIKEYIVGEAK
ncbi:MAG: hypothetical protein WC438_06395 [Candidatus Pacearchaeota archaeon]